MKINNRITKRDIAFFIFGLFIMLLVEIIFNWGNNVKAFKKGWNAAESSQTEIRK